jgi:hypothetical protein
MEIVLRNLELLLKWNIENNGSEVERKMLQESVELVKEQIAIENLDRYT